MDRTNILYFPFIYTSHCGHNDAGLYSCTHYVFHLHQDNISAHPCLAFFPPSPFRSPSSHNDSGLFIHIRNLFSIETHNLLSIHTHNHLSIHVHNLLLIDIHNLFSIHTRNSFSIHIHNLFAIHINIISAPTPFLLFFPLAL